MKFVRAVGIATDETSTRIWKEKFGINKPLDKISFDEVKNFVQERNNDQ
jgi:hypothetical protein